MIQTKRVYEEPQKNDGYRILVDRLWPRGVTKQKAAIDLWLKEIAPSNELRTWFSHDPSKWSEFQRKYREELRGKKKSLDAIRSIERQKKSVTLVYGAKDTNHNNAIVISNVLKKESSR
jgi:uncharacterized protein YeaO (DUF488 family)